MKENPVEGNVVFGGKSYLCHIFVISCSPKFMSVIEKSNNICKKYFFGDCLFLHSSHQILFYFAFMSSFLFPVSYLRKWYLVFFNSSLSQKSGKETSLEFGLFKFLLCLRTLFRFGQVILPCTSIFICHVGIALYLTARWLWMNTLEFMLWLDSSLWR